MFFYSYFNCLKNNVKRAFNPERFYLFQSNKDLILRLNSNFKQENSFYFFRQFSLKLPTVRACFSTRGSNPTRTQRGRIMTNRTIFSLKTKFNVLTFINPFFNEWIEFNYYSDLVIILKKNRDSVLVCEDSPAFFIVLIQV